MTRLVELTRKVDVFFARVVDRHGTDMQCQTGCSDCCHVRLTITGVEEAAIREHVATWSSRERRNLAESGPAAPATGVTAPPMVRCAALDPAGRCKIYDARPLVCRSHGVPIRLRRGSLAVVEACHRNFRHTIPDPDCILDQTTLSAMLLAVDATEAGAARAAARRAQPGRPGPAGDPGRPGATGQITRSRHRGRASVVGQPGPSQPGPPGQPGTLGEPGHRVELAHLLAELAAI